MKKTIIFIIVLSILIIFFTFVIEKENFNLADDLTYRSPELNFYYDENPQLTEKNISSYDQFLNSLIIEYRESAKESLEKTYEKNNFFENYFYIISGEYEKDNEEYITNAIKLGLVLSERNRIKINHQRDPYSSCSNLNDLTIEKCKKIVREIKELFENFNEE